MKLMHKTKIMENKMKETLIEQTRKIDKILNTLRTKFGDDFEDEINYLEIVKNNLLDQACK